MSIGGINGNPSVSHWRSHGSQVQSRPMPGQAAANGAASSIANTGSVSSGDMASFFKSFSADLQAMMAKAANGPGGTGAATQTAANQPMSGAHHHHHRTEGSGNASMRSAANQAPGEGSPTADVVQALKAYGSTGAATARTGTVA